MGTLHHHHPHVPALPMAFNENSEKSSNPNVINAASTGNSSNCSSSADFSSADWSDRIHSLVGRCYRRWAQFVVMHPVKIILFCFVLTGICAMNMVKTKHRNSIRGYTPYGARALHEFDVRDEFFGQTGVGIRFFVLVLPKMGSNLLDKEMLKETVEVDTLIQNNLTIYNHIHQRNESFSQYCNRFCLLNEPVTAFSNAWADQQDQMAKGAPPTDRIRLDYPFSNIMGREVNIQPNLFGVHLANHNTSHGRNRTASFTNMESVEMIVLLYRAERVGGWTDEDISQYEMGVSDYFKNHFVGRHIRVLTISTSYASVEVDRSGNILRSRIGIGLAIMILCSMLTTSLSAFFMRQFSVYKLPVALFACLCPFMASGTALGLLFFFGVRNSSILGLTPFLILAIGIDDAFLMIHSWQLASSRRRKLTLTGPGAQQQKSSDDIDRTVADQLAEVLEDTGPAILISALTNILADVVGSFTGSPEITLLCMGNIASIIVDFFYQITLFTAVLVICARFELRAEQRQKQPSQKQQKQQQWHSKVAPLEDKSKAQHSGKVEDGPVAPPSSSFSSSAFRSVGIRRSLESGFKQFTSLYVRFVSNIFASILICFLWVAFLLVCMNAMLRFEINLTTKKLFPPDSPLLEIENFREDKVLPQYTTAQLFVNNPGDLTNDTRRRHLDELIEEMEHLQFAYPPESSFYFVRTFEAFQRENEENYLGEEEEEAEQKTNLTSIGHKRHGKSSFNLDDLESFLDWTEYKHWRGLLNFHTENDTRTGESHVVLDSFMATVAYHGEQLKDWYSRARVLNSWRRVVDKYSEEFNVTVLHDDGLYLDLLENMPTDIWQSGLGTLLCMAAICALFMNNLFVVVVTTGVIASIFVETLGLMSMMGLTMDPVVMAAVVISMGFSVDIPAHVSYHFHMAKWTRDPQGRKRPRSVEHRVRKAFASVGFPALQASTCTNICILTLLLVPLWMSQVFVHVLCTCLTLCTIHSLVLLPALFTLVASIDQQFCQRTDAESENKSGRKRPSVRI